MSEILSFRQSVEAFIAARGWTPTRFGRAIAGDPLFVFDLREGREPRSDTRARILKAMQEYSDDGSLYAMGALELTSDFTDGQISDWIDYESAGNGEVQTTPGGLSVWYEPPAADSTYALYLWILGKYGMYVTLDVGIDGLPFVDAFTTANFE